MESGRFLKEISDTFKDLGGSSENWDRKVKRDKENLYGSVE